MNEIYLDNAATTKVTEEVLQAMLPYLTGEYGNPSSIHKKGQEAKKAVEKAREQVANVINAEPEQIFFTSGATESNNIIFKQDDYLVATSMYEHPSMRSGIIEKLQRDITFPNNKEKFYNALGFAEFGGFDMIVSHIFVNNETGEIYDIKKLCDMAHEYIIEPYDNRVLFHTDATQAFGHIPIDVKALNVDFMSLSGHKFHAPKGVGVLYVKDPKTINPVTYGGGQERGLRSGTENVASIVGIGKAAELYNYSKDEDARLWDINYMIRNGIKWDIPDTMFTLDYDEVNKSNHIISVAFKGVYGGDLVELMSKHGVYISSGSACSSNNHKGYSKTIANSRLPDDMKDCVVRLSLSKFTTYEEGECAVKELVKCVKQIRVVR